jgi:hypothetical protein
MVSTAGYMVVSLLSIIAVKSAGANEFSGVSGTELESRLQNPFTESKNN